jgi:hypothetical protein
MSSGSAGAGGSSPSAAEVDRPGRRSLHQRLPDGQRGLHREVAGPDHRSGEAVPDAEAAEARGPREVRGEARAAVQEPGSPLSGSDGAAAAPSAACGGQDQAEAPKIQAPDEPPLAASALRERATAMTRPRTGHFHFAKNRTLSRCVYTCISHLDFRFYYAINYRHRKVLYANKLI